MCTLNTIFFVVDGFCPCVLYIYEKENFGVHSECFLNINIIYPTYTVSLS